VLEGGEYDLHIFPCAGDAAGKVNY
jgi:hypothetical protein